MDIRQLGSSLLPTSLAPGGSFSEASGGADFPLFSALIWGDWLGLDPVSWAKICPENPKHKAKMKSYFLVINIW